MHLDDVRRAIRRAVLTAIASSAIVAANGCSCTNAIVVSPIGDAAVPDGVTGLASDRQLTADECSLLCRSRSTRCQIVHLCSEPTCTLPDGGFGPVTDSPLAVACDEPAICPIGGRRPQGFAWDARDGETTDDAGDFFARLAGLESASITAFRRLARELAFHGADASLVNDAEEAARDEVRHARLTTSIARHFGATISSVPTDDDLPIRSLVEIAVENAVEGCVRETFGAAIAAWQAARSTDAYVARSMRSIARDEAGHAALAWRVAQWIDSRLDATERRMLADAMTSAIATLHCESRYEPSDSLVRHAGLPRAHESAALLRELGDTLWSRAMLASA